MAAKQQTPCVDTFEAASVSATIKACGQWQLAIELLTMASCQMIQPSIDTWPWIKWAGVCLNEVHQIYLRKSTSMVGLQITGVRSSGYVTICGMSFSLGLFGASYLHFSSPRFHIQYGWIWVMVTRQTTSQGHTP